MHGVGVWGRRAISTSLTVHVDPKRSRAAIFSDISDQNGGHSRQVGDSRASPDKFPKYYQLINKSTSFFQVAKKILEVNLLGFSKTFQFLASKYSKKIFHQNPNYF